jgi:nitroreductase
MDIHELIRTRRSVRKHTGDEVTAAQLERILEAIQWAPSWVNFQPWEVIVVEDPAVRERLAECVPAVNPGRKSVTRAPVLLAMCGRLGESGFYQGAASTAYGDWVMFDLGIATQNACLAAWEMGLGTLHLGLLDHAAAGEVLGLPDNVKCYELIPVGVPMKNGKAPPRKAVAEFTHKNAFGTKYSK